MGNLRAPRCSPVEDWRRPVKVVCSCVPTTSVTLRFGQVSAAHHGTPVWRPTAPGLAAHRWPL
eukprot:3990367-Pyramimonas_sp.AAC.1